MKYSISQYDCKEKGYKKMKTSYQEVFYTLWDPREQTREPVFSFPTHIE